mgnify:CR=1 FL=1
MYIRVNDFWVFFRGDEFKGFYNFYIGSAWALAQCK